MACLMAVVAQIVPAAAQTAYDYPNYPRVAPEPYFDGAPHRRGARVVYDEDGNAIVVNRRGRPLYYLSDGAPMGSYGDRRRYVRAMPGPYGDEPPAPPYFADPRAGRAPPSDSSIGMPGAQAGVTPFAPPLFQPPGVRPQIAPRVQPAVPAESQQPLIQQSSLPPDGATSSGSPAELPAQFRRQVIVYNGKEQAGTIIVDTRHTYLYYVLGNGRAMRYGIGVGREGFTWSGREKISRMAEWPDWYPPEDMLQRQPYLPRMMAGGPGNPLGARALYLGNTLYRIHGTNDPTTIGKYVSSGCIRLTNEDVEDLYQRVHVGTHVVVLPGGGARTAKR